MTVPDVVVPVSGTRIVVLACSVFALGLALTWTFLGMRSVMDVGRRPRSSRSRSH